MSIETFPHRVLRAICMAGERVEVDAIVHLTRTQGTELAAAGKVQRLTDDEAAALAAAPAGKAAKSKTEPAK